MSPILAEIFPYLTKLLADKKDLLDYKWIVRSIENPYGILEQDDLYNKAFDGVQKANLTTDQDLFTSENYPMPFEKFFFVAEVHEKIPQYLCRYEVFQFQRNEGLITCRLYTIYKKPVGFKGYPTVAFNCLGFQSDGQYLFEARTMAGSPIDLKSLDIPCEDPVLNRMFKQGELDEKPTWGKHFAFITYFALTCSTYGMFGPVSDTQHYYSTTNPDPIRNAQKIARGNRPKFEWVTSVIEPRTTAPALVLHKGGTHASPKPHERRAHFRRLKSGKSVLVRSTFINKDKMGERGFVFHDYELKAQEVMPRA